MYVATILTLVGISTLLAGYSLQKGYVCVITLSDDSPVNETVCSLCAINITMI